MPDAGNSDAEVAAVPIFWVVRSSSSRLCSSWSKASDGLSTTSDVDVNVLDLLSEGSSLPSARLSRYVSKLKRWPYIRNTQLVSVGLT